MDNGGLKKDVLREGQAGQRPQKNQTVTVHYVGTLANGSTFDSSRAKNRPFSFELGAGKVIKAWDTLVAQMNKGELARLTCPPEFAYGARGFPPVIPANSTLFFEVELLSYQ